MPRQVLFMAIFALLLGVAIVTLEVSLTSTALPTISLALGVSSGTTIWIVSIYYLAISAVLLPLAALGEIYGHRRIFMTGLGVFATGSLICGLSSSLGMLMCGRALLGAGAAAVSATTPALVRAIYPPQRLAKGFGIYAMIVSVAFTIGPTTASAVLSVASWPWLFLINIPIALLTMLLAASGLPDSGRSPRR